MTFKNNKNFWNGFFSAFNIFGQFEYQRINPRVKATANMSNAWLRVGNAMQKAMGDLEQDYNDKSIRK